MSGIIPGQHVIVNKNSGVDPYGLFPKNNPKSGGFYSIKLGDDKYTPQSQAYRAAYSYDIPANATNFSVTYYYAMVSATSATSEHSFQSRPRFQTKSLGWAV